VVIAASAGTPAFSTATLNAKLSISEPAAPLLAPAIG
jgi:hypothetical protein